MAVNVLPWGNTCPLLEIAQHYGVPYETTLYLADRIQHRRHPPQGIEVWDGVPIKIIESIEQDVRYVCAWMADVRNGSIQI